MRLLTKWSCLFLVSTGGMLLISTPCFSSDAQNWAVVDRALLDSLQNLKSSMASVENSNQALRLENDFYRRQIEAIQQALNPSPEPPPAPPVEKPDFESKTRKLQDQVSARMTEEYQSLQQQRQQLREAVAAKNVSIENLQVQVNEVLAQMDVIQQQMAAMDEAVDENPAQQIRDLQESYRQSVDDLLQQQQQSDAIASKAKAVKVVADSELANKDLWTKMQKLEADLRELSEQSQNLQQTQINDQGERQKIADDLEADIQSLSRQLEVIQQELKGASSPAVATPDDQVLQDYRQKLQQQNQLLRQQVETLRQALPD